MNVRASGYDDLCHAPNSPLNRDTFLVLEKSRRLESCRSRQQYQHRSLFGIFGCDRSGLFLISGSGACRHVSMNPYRMWVIPTSRSAASETENPRRNIAKAVRRVFYRIAVFYVSQNSGPPRSLHDVDL